MQITCRYRKQTFNAKRYMSSPSVRSLRSLRIRANSHVIKSYYDFKQAVGGRPPRYAPAPLLPSVGPEALCAAEQTAT